MELINGRTVEEIKRNLSYLVRCEICPQNHEYGCDYEKRTKECQTTDDALALIECLEAQVPRWISVEERLPEPFVSVLVHMPEEQPHPTVREGYISNDGVWVAGSFAREYGDVTHWAEMPEPPKEGAHE